MYFFPSLVSIYRYEGNILFLIVKLTLIILSYGNTNSVSQKLAGRTCGNT